MLFVFYVIFVLINSIDCQNAFKREANPSLCNFFDTINITDGYHNPYDDSITFDGIRFAKQNYATFTYTYLANYEKISVPAHIRGCLCKYKNCVRLCCPQGHSFAQIKIDNNFGHKCEPNDSVHEIILEGYPNMAFVRGMPCITGFLLDPAERLHQWKILYGAGKEIREAIKEPTPLTQERAWNAILPLVIKLKRCYEHSLELEKIVPKLLGQLVGGRLNPTQHLETQQALVKQLADILEFVLKFDEYKMKTPAIQNDFSYYRRTVVSRQRFENQSQMLVSSELANRMSLFYAHATPMLKVLSEATSKFVRDNADDVDNTTETLGTMAKVCLRMLDNPTLLKQIEREETQFLLLRVMVGLVILYDHVHPVGAFARGAHVDVKGCVRLLQQQPASKAEPLLNALRYTTKHLNEENTPKNIRNLLAA